MVKAAALVITVLAAMPGCGISPRPVNPSVRNDSPTVLGNERRAPYENEIVPDSLRVVWDVNAGSGTRSPVLFTDSAVFIGTSNRQLLAFSTSTGGKYWDQRVEGEIAGQLIRSGRTIFLATSEWNGRTHALDVERGRRVWRHDTGPVRFSPLLDGGIVYLGTDKSSVLALRSEDGEQIWRIRIGGSIAASLLSHGDAIIAVTGSDSIYAIDKRAGTIVRRGKLESSVAAPLAQRGDTIVAVTHGGAVYGVSASTFAKLWQVDTGAPVLSAPAITEDGTIHVMNRNGELWRIIGGRGAKVAQIAHAVVGSFTVARDRYVVGDVDGTLTVADRSGRVVAEHHFNDGIYAPVAVGGRALYITLGRGRLVKLQ